MNIIRKLQQRRPHGVSRTRRRLAIFPIDIHGVPHQGHYYVRERWVYTEREEADGSRTFLSAAWETYDVWVPRIA